MMKIVLDPSVAIKWFIREDESLLREADYVLDALSRYEATLVPPHFYMEVGTTLYRKMRDRAQNILEQLLDATFVTVHIDLHLLKTTDRLMMKYHSIVFYDAIYHAIALHGHNDFVTADEKYYEIAKKEGHIMLLKNFL